MSWTSAPAASSVETIMMHRGFCSPNATGSIETFTVVVAPGATTT
jgi:hypothetical protein